LYNYLKNIILRLCKSSLLKNSSIYTITNVLNSSIPFLLIPVLTRYLAPDEYGVANMFVVLYSFYAPFVGLSVHGLVQVKYFKRESVDLPVFIANAIYLLIVSSVCCFIITFLFSHKISTIAGFPENWLYVVIVFSFLQFIYMTVLRLIQSQQKPFHYGIYQISITIINFTLSLVFVVLWRMGWEGRVMGQFLAMVISAVYAIYFLLKNNLLRLKYNKVYFIEALKYGLPLIPHSFGAIVISMADRFFIVKYCGMAANGIYSLGFQISLVIMYLQDAFNNAFVPYLMSNLKRNSFEIKRKIVRYTYLYFIGILVITVLFYYAVSIFFPYFVGDKYNDSLPFVIWISLGFAFNGMYKMVVNYIFFEEKTKYLAYITFTTAILNIVLDYLLISNPSIGMKGAAYANCLSWFVCFVLTWIVSNKVYKMPWFSAFKRI